MANSTLYNSADLAQFYDLDNPWEDDFSACVGLAKGAHSLLDLGCGTGALVAHLAPTLKAVGVDPAAAMLDIAKARTSSPQATWIEGDARSLDLGQVFDLIVLTGHSFQVFLSEADQRAVLATIVRHLAPKGRFIFDSRNPDCRAWESWTPAHSMRQFEHPKLATIQAWNEASFEPSSSIATYHSHYRIAASGAVLSSASQIKFTARADLEQMIEAAGLTVEHWLGDWNGAPCDQHSKDFIPIGRVR